MYALLSRFLGIDGFFPTNTKFCELDLDFALQWTHNDNDFNLTVLFHTINHMYVLLGRFVGIDKFFPINTKFCDLDLDFALDLSLFFFLLQPVLFTLTVNIFSFKVTYNLSALVFSVYVAASQSGHTAFSSFLLIYCDVKFAQFQTGASLLKHYIEHAYMISLYPCDISFPLIPCHDLNLPLIYM